jgi:hypothetical protein
MPVQAGYLHAYEILRVKASGSGKEPARKEPNHADEDVRTVEAGHDEKALTK